MMREESGRVVLQGGSDLSLRTIAGWVGCTLFVRVRSLGAIPGLVRFRAIREAQGSRVTAAHGVLYATQKGYSGQPITVRDVSELIDLRVSLRYGADPVEIEWIAREPSYPAAAAIATSADFLPVGASGAAATPRVDAWGRALVAAAPPQATFHKKHSLPDGGLYSQFLLDPGELLALFGGSGGDKIAGLIAITGFMTRSAGGGTFELKNTVLTVPGHGPLLVVPTGAEGAVRHNFPASSPPLFRFDSGIGVYPVLTSGGEMVGDPYTVELFGYVLFDQAGGEGT